MGGAGLGGKRRGGKFISCRESGGLVANTGAAERTLTVHRTIALPANRPKCRFYRAI